MKRAALLLLFALMLTGCSQVAAVAPVGGGHQAEVRYAAIDVLLDADVEILVAPVCEADAEVITCAGETVSGEPIVVTSTATDVEVTAGSKVIYSGSITEILDRAAS